MADNFFGRYSGLVGGGSSGSATPKMVLVNNNNNTQTVTPNTIQTVIFSTVVYDDTMGYNNSTGVWTAPSNGILDVDINITYVNPQEGQYYAGIKHNTTYVSTQGGWASTNANNGVQSFAASLTVKITSGDTVQAVTGAFDSPGFPITSATLLGGVFPGGNDTLGMTMKFTPSS